MTRPYVEVIGDPIAHSKSPLIHNFWLEKLGIDAEYRATHVRPDELADYFARRRGDAAWRGCNVTIPHKQTALDLLADKDRRAAAIGAINTVYRTGDRRLVGTNTDSVGVGEAIRELTLIGADVCVIGAGGAARAAFSQLAASRCAAVLILARDPRKALQTASEFDIFAVGVEFAPGSTALCEASLLINATQLGLEGQDAMPDFLLAELAEMPRDAAVFDMVYSPVETPLLAQARALGLRTIDGLQMLVGQAAAAFELFFGRTAPREHDAELRALLTS
ncbi:MAG: shikimate dehydrogenase [Sphingomonadaceae bacterium]|nr:shikimate dehydrogenase [Sphingomonadaceae bacterium]